jgi:hypothetical protein
MARGQRIECKQVHGRLLRKSRDPSEEEENWINSNLAPRSAIVGSPNWDVNTKENVEIY